MKINFGTENSTLPSEEYVLDFGEGYSAEQGYGWVRQDSLDNGTVTSINITANTRDRDGIEDQPTDTLIHLQYPDDLPGITGMDAPARTSAAWEYELENGTYQVTVSVGDPEYTDSNHVINIEGESVISGFAPTSDQLFTEVTTQVEVKDGKLTLDAIGGENTKLNFVEINAEDGSELETPRGDNSDTDTDTDTDSGNDDPGNGAINFSFGATGAVSPPGFIQDFGEAYDAERGYGWVTEDSAGSENPTPINMVANARNRDPLLDDCEGSELEDSTRDSLIHLQYPTGAGIFNPTAQTTPAAWEYDLANGQYEVTVGVGDSEFVDSNHVINVEGENLISNFTPTAGEKEFTEGSAIVEVDDGRLTVDAIGGENTKINYISLVPVEVG